MEMATIDRGIIKLENGNIRLEVILRSVPNGAAIVGMHKDIKIPNEKIIPTEDAEDLVKTISETYAMLEMQAIRFFKDWDATEDVPYRVTYDLDTTEGGTRTYEYWL